MIPSKLLMAPTNKELVLADGLYDRGTAAYFGAGANVVATLTDWQGNEVAGCIAIQLSYTANTNGNFQGVVDQSFAPAIGAGYTLTITAVQGAAYGQWKIPVEIQVRVNQFS